MKKFYSYNGAKRRKRHLMFINRSKWKYSFRRKDDNILSTSMNNTFDEVARAMERQIQGKPSKANKYLWRIGFAMAILGLIGAIGKELF